MIQPRQLPDTLRAAAWFVWRNFDWAQDIGRNLLWQWIGWHSTQQSIAIVHDEYGHVCGVGTARPVMNAQRAAYDCYDFDPEGQFLFVDMAVATTSSAFLMLFLTMLDRFGERPFIAYRRYPDPFVKIQPLEKMKRNLLREGLIYGRR